MWNKFSIKIQLTVFMVVIISVVELSTLYFVYQYQKEEIKENSLLEIDTITKSFNNDLIEVILNPNADMVSDITYRLTAFKEIEGLLLLDGDKNSIFKYSNIDKIKDMQEIIFSKNSIFLKNQLLIKKLIIAENYTFGYALFNIDLGTYKEKQLDTIYTILSIFPFALIFGLILSWFLSRSYTKPFIKLIDAMKKSDPTSDKITKVETTANNEIKELFDGFNTQMNQIVSSSNKLQFQATHDQLTNIFNRFHMENIINNSLKKQNKYGYNLLYLDLDQFKLINDQAGYQAGDELLKMVVLHYQNILPSNAIFARVDGNGFMVLLENCSFEDGKIFLQKSLEKLQDFRFSHNNETFSVSASISLIYFKAFEYTVKELLKASSVALFTAKAKGRNKSHIYDKGDETLKRISLEQQSAKLIKEALKDGPSKFELFAQDIVPLQTKSDKISYEILIRMWDQDNNFIPPNDFLPAAERYQLMSEIDVYVLWTYLETVTKDKKHIEKLHSAHINLAGSSLNNPDFQAKVKEAIEHFDFPWEKLELEITESSAIGSFNMANEFISWLKDKKIGLALDDFGTGMASFEYLKSMPFDVVKIDGSFVKDMHNDPTDKAVIKYIQEIATLKNQETVAEYVETKEDVEELTKIGVTYGQGYYLGKPRALSSWLSK
ncbi:MAG: EAL domain-containing protein [Halarcobacter sp.]